MKLYDAAVPTLTEQLCAPVGTVIVLETEQVVTMTVGAEARYALTVYVVATPSAVNLANTLYAVAEVGEPRLTRVGAAMIAAGVKDAEGPDVVDVVLLPEGVTVNV